MIQAGSKNEQGLTLVEVLAALVILAILFIGIMTIFPQMTAFNTKTETKLDTMNLARQEMAEIVSENHWIAQLPEPTGISEPEENAYFETLAHDKMTDLGYSLENETTEIFRFSKIEGYFYEVDIYKECEPYWTEGTTETANCDNIEIQQLYKVHLKVFDRAADSGTGRFSSESYSYIPFVVKSQGETP